MTPTESHERPRLLIVDDEARILTALQRALRREGYVIHTAETPIEGLEVLAQGHVDMILSDNKMPGMSGQQFLAEASQRYPHLVCFLITGWTESVPQEELERCGVRQLLTKPWDNETLRALLREAMVEKGFAMSGGGPSGGPKGGETAGPTETSTEASPSETQD